MLMKSLLRLAAIAGAVLFLAFPVTAQQQEFGDIDFPTSGAADAQASFLEGVKALHSFQFTEAGIAFRRAQELDPSFAMAYWGEAMSLNHPLWAQQDTEGAKRILEKVAATPAGRQASVGLEKEKAWFDAIDTLYYSEGDKLQRDKAYSQKMAAMSERWPDDHEVQIFHALSLLGTMRPGDRGYRRQAQAAAISQRVFDENPNHPGAAHFIIHSFDDPDHAILALPAAEVYADIAPSAAHALHMPSHIFVQLGQWERVVKSNIDAYGAAMRVVNELDAAEGGEDFHTLSWLAYGYLMLGDEAMAEKQLARAREAVERNSASQRVEDGYLKMRARHVIETNQREKLALPEANDVAGMNDNWVATIGMVAARNGDEATVAAVLKRLEGFRQNAEQAGDSYLANKTHILEGEVSALNHLQRGELQEAARRASEAADIELAIGAPSGPPEPLKPALELYGEVLLAAGRYDDAMTAFESSLTWVPQRTPSLLGLARAAEKAGRRDLAASQYRSIVDMPGVEKDSDTYREAREFLNSNTS